MSSNSGWTLIPGCLPTNMFPVFYSRPMNCTFWGKAQDFEPWRYSPDDSDGRAALGNLWSSDLKKKVASKMVLKVPVTLIFPGQPSLDHSSLQACTCTHEQVCPEPLHSPVPLHSCSFCLCVGSSVHLIYLPIPPPTILKYQFPYKPCTLPLCISGAVTFLYEFSKHQRNTMSQEPDAEHLWYTAQLAWPLGL